MEKPGLNDSASVTGDTESDDSSAKGSVIESKTFRDGLIYLYKRADFKKPTWLCRIKVPGTKGYINRSTKTGDEFQAFKFADDLYNQLHIKYLKGEAPIGKRMGPVIDAYIKRIEPHRERTYFRYKILLMKRVKPFLERQTFEELSTATLSQLVDHLTEITRKGHLSPNTVKRIFADLKHFLNWCVEEGHLTSIPRFPKVSTDSARRAHFNAEEWTKLTKSMYRYLKDSPKNAVRSRQLLMLYILVLGETGIRVGEARKLRWRDLRPIGADGRNIALMVKGKTGIREVVASSPLVRDAMGELLRIRKKDLTDEGSDIYEQESVPMDSFVFCNKRGRTIQSFKKSFATFLKKIKLEKDTFGKQRTIYSLRHTYATARLEAGVNHYILAQNMGTSVGMLEKHYGHTSNIAMVDELTRPKVKRAAQAEDNNGAFGWLETKGK